MYMTVHLATFHRIFRLCNNIFLHIDYTGIFFEYVSLYSAESIVTRIEVYWFAKKSFEYCNIKLSELVPVLLNFICSQTWWGIIVEFSSLNETFRWGIIIEFSSLNETFIILYNSFSVGFIEDDLILQKEIPTKEFVFDAEVTWGFLDVFWLLRTNKSNKGCVWYCGTDPSFRSLRGAPCEALCIFCVILIVQS